MVVPRKHTSLLAAGLFLVFGAKMLKGGLEMTSGTASVQDEIKEVEQELQEKDFTSPPSPTMTFETLPIEALEAGSTWKPRRRNSTNKLTARASGGVINLLNLLFSPVFVQTFIMTFLGEWGIEVKLRQLRLLLHQVPFHPLMLGLMIDFWYVTVGTVIAHGCCTALAVIGGRLLASKITVRNGTLKFSVDC